MVKNNQIPIEVNKKPFETVQELKNEVPSYEEFMKTYERDDNLNYDDLSDGGIGEVKGYGPCNYSNRDCTHYTYRNFVQLYLGCPADGCCSDKSDASSWIHRYCGGYIYISTGLELECMKCGRNNDMWSWSFKCYSREHKGDYEKSNPSSFFNALTFVGNDTHHRVPEVRSRLKIITIKLMEKAGW